MAVESIYIRYNNYVASVVANGSLHGFKSHGDYNGILEHVSYEYGLQYLANLRDVMSNEVIACYCQMNDKIGGGIKYNYGFITTSPSNFRYLFHAHLALTHWKSLKIQPTTFVEMGCGYGGLTLAISFLCNQPQYNIPIKKYCMIDLPTITNLQKLYLSHHSLNFEVEFYSAFNYGSDILYTNMYLISNYCFSEISKENQEQYISNLFPRVAHGFMAWNAIPVYSFGFATRDVEEYPLTFVGNRYVFF